MRLTALTILLSFIAAMALAGPREDLDEAMDAYWALELKRNPIFATAQGERKYDDRLGSIALDSMEEAKKAYSDLLDDLDSIDTDALSKDDRLNLDLLTYALRGHVAALSYPHRAMILTRFEGWHFTLARLPDSVPFKTVQDYESYIARLLDFARLNAEGIATTRWAINNQLTQPCDALGGYGNSITAQIAVQPEDSTLWAPFKKRPGFITPPVWRDLRARGRAAIGDTVMPALKDWAGVYEREYLPACRADVGISSTQRGEDYYAHRIKRYTSLTLSAREIHQTGLSEVSRIRREMRAVIDEANFDGDLRAFQAYLRETPALYAKTPSELLEKTALVAKKADGALPTLFGHLPRMPYTIKPIPMEIAPGNTTAYYEEPAGDGTRPGVYRVNTTQLDQRPLFELEALTLHEAVPGHHLQIAIQQELDTLPKFRQRSTHNAYVEGWGLYAEKLGQEMGFYEDPYSNFGRLSYEMWRACRLVVDTGIHALGWSRERAIDYMMDNTALARANVEAEVDRYITWPGQALGYKLGEITIKDLRALAEKTLGDAFDVRAFHDAILGQGDLPLSMLEEHIRDWIVAQGGILPRQANARGEGERGERPKAGRQRRPRN